MRYPLRHKSFGIYDALVFAKVVPNVHSAMGKKNESGLKMMGLPRFELGLLDSESKVLAITP